MTLTKDDLDDALASISKQSNDASDRKHRLAKWSLVFSICATMTGGIAGYIANENKQELEEASQRLLAGQARMELIEASVKYLERMVDGKTEADRKRACNIALEMGLVEASLGVSNHIIRLHQKYLDLRPITEGEVPDNCATRSDEAAASVKVQNSPKELASSRSTDQLGPQVIVMASYRLQNCLIASGARDALAKYFGQKVDNSTIQIALSRSQHYGVVYNPDEKSMDLRDFLAFARTEGRTVREAVEAKAPVTDVQRENVQYVSEAYVANTEGWELVANCP